MSAERSEVPGPVDRTGPSVPVGSRDWVAFRAEFPVCAQVRYLNAGSEGPVPAAVGVAVRERLRADLELGRTGAAYIDGVFAAAAAVRAGYARVLGAPEAAVALTESTTSAINTVLGGLPWAPGSEILTSDQEHPGLLAPLRRLSRLHGVRIRVAPFAELAAAVRPETTLIAASHVSWVSGEVIDVAALMAHGVPVLLDGAQALGAIPLDVSRLGIDFYAAAGQKWLCGPEGSGVLYVRPDRLGDLEPPWPNHATVADPDAALTSPLTHGAARLDTGFPPAQRSAWALAALEVLDGAGWSWIHDRAAFMARSLADGLAARGLTVAPRGASTLVAWTPREGTPETEVARLAAAGLVVRSIPSRGLLRAACGAWTSEEDLAALLGAVG